MYTPRHTNKRCSIATIVPTYILVYDIEQVIAGHSYYVALGWVRLDLIVLKWYVQEHKSLIEQLWPTSAL